MNKAMVLAIILSSCVCGDDKRTTGQYATDMCGQLPQVPGTVVYFPGDGRAILWKDNYVEIIDAMRKLSDWTFCVQNLQ